MSSLKLRLRLYTPTGTRGRVIPTMTLNLDQVFGDVSSCRATISGKAYANLPEFPIVAAVEFSGGGTWTEISNARFVFEGDDLDAVDPAKVRTITGVQYVPWMLQRVLQQNSASAKNGQRTWSPNGASPGQIVAGMMLEGHNRGWAPFITTTATAALDSSGTAWATKSLKIAYDLGVPLWQVLTGLVSQGVCEFVTVGNGLYLYNPGGHGRDWTTGPTIVQLSHEATKLPVKRSWAPVLTDLTLAGDNNLLATVHNAGAPTTFGRLEGWVDSSGSKDKATLTALGQKTLTQASAPNREIQITADAHSMPNLPWITYGISDWVLFRAEKGWEKGRVVELVCNQDQDGKVEITTVIGDRNQTLLSKLAKKTAGQTKGAVTGGNGKPVIVAPNPPIAPDALTGTTEGYWDVAGAPHARVSLSWAAVTTSDDGEPVDVNQYQVWMRLEGQAKATSLATVGTNTFMRDGLPVGVTGYFSVRAMSSTGVWGPLTAEIGIALAGPNGKLPTPSAPTFLAAPQGMLAHWDGQLGGAEPPAWFSHLYAISSTTENGTYARIGAPLAGAGDILLPTAAAVWVRFVAVDVQGAESDWSPAAQVTGQPAKPGSFAVASNIGGWDSNGAPIGHVTLTWGAVTTDILGNPATVDFYQVWIRHGDGTPSLLAQTVTELTVALTLPPAADVQVMVRAHSATGYWSDFTDELNITPSGPTDTLPAPSDPTVSTAHSVLVVSWDGLLSTLTPPAHFWHVILERAPDVNGAPGDFFQVGERSTAGTMNVSDVSMGDIVWVRLTAIDKAGRAGASSNAVQATVVGVDGDDIVAGSITVNNLSPTIGGQLDISANDSITLTAGRIDDVQDGLDDTNSALEHQQTQMSYADDDALEHQQTVFSVQPDGAHIYSPGGENELVIRDDEIDMQVNGVTVTYWNQQVMFVQSAVVTEMVIGNIHFQQDGDGTLIRAV